MRFVDPYQCGLTGLTCSCMVAENVINGFEKNETLSRCACLWTLWNSVKPCKVLSSTKWTIIECIDKFTELSLHYANLLNKTKVTAETLFTYMYILIKLISNSDKTNCIPFSAAINQFICIDGRMYHFSWEGLGLLHGSTLLAALHRDTLQPINLSKPNKGDRWGIGIFLHFFSLSKTIKVSICNFKACWICNDNWVIIFVNFPLKR